LAAAREGRKLTLGSFPDISLKRDRPTKRCERFAKAEIRVPRRRREGERCQHGRGGRFEQQPPPEPLPPKNGGVVIG
jgi:hypothetical protein